MSIGRGRHKRQMATDGIYDSRINFSGRPTSTRGKGGRLGRCGLCLGKPWPARTVMISGEEQLHIIESGGPEDTGAIYKRYDKKLGTGAYKDVFLAYDMEAGRDVAWNTESRALTGLCRVEAGKKPESVCVSPGEVRASSKRRAGADRARDGSLGEGLTQEYHQVLQRLAERPQERGLSCYSSNGLA
eukprot:221731-Amorphochlora_amoeboformis.AAC.1